MPSSFYHTVIVLLGLFLALLPVGCSNKQAHNSVSRDSYPALQELYSYSFAAGDSLVTENFSQFGFTVDYPRSFSLTLRNRFRPIITLDRHDTTFASITVYSLNSRDFDRAGDTLRPQLDSIQWFACRTSQWQFAADAPDGSSTEFTRIDSSKLYRTRHALRVIAVFQTWYQHYWAPLPEIPPHLEKRIAPFFWVDLTTSRSKSLLQVIQPSPESDTLTINPFVISLVESINPVN